MPVLLRKDEQMVSTARSDDSNRDRADWAEATLAGLRSAMICLVPSAILLVLVLWYMASSLAAANQLAGAGVEGHLPPPCEPVVVFGFLGAVFGGLVGWRLSSTVGLVGAVGWVLAIGVILALTLVGGFAVVRIFPAGVPALAWASVAVVGLAAFGGLYLFTVWTH
jgi:hypothetical protein